MALSRSVVAAAALSLVQLTQAWNVELPPCLDEFKPFVYSGCFQDGGPGQPPALIFRSTLSASDMTVEKCVAECKGNGFRYAGLEYYGVCYCGGTVNGPQLDEAQCSFPCNGNKTETCGGDNSLSVWQDPTFVTDPDDDIGRYTSSGCYTDNSPLGRTLSWAANVDANTFTTEGCLAACEKQGFPLAGTEYGSECWCGNVLANDTAKVDDSECNMPCKGNPAQTCGAGGRLNLYVAKELESLEPCGYKPPVSSSSTSESISTSTSIPSSSSSSVSSTSQQPPVTTTAPPTTTTKPPVTTSSTTSACTVTVTTPPSCEWKCGNWCFPPLPDWSNEKDCLKSYASCLSGVASCFRNAGWPGSLQCFSFGQWCGNILAYCSTTCRSGKCSKGDCWNRHPGNGSPPRTTTTVVPCPPATATTTTATTTKPTQCPPPPTNICTQPSNPKYGYGPGKPVGGIALPIVSCNDDYSDWRSNPFKLYVDQNSARCPSYPPKGCPNACADACKEQWQQCKNVYQKGCQDAWSGAGGRRARSTQEDEQEVEEAEKRGISLNLNLGIFTSGWGSGDNTPSKASEKCDAQYKDCLKVNKNVDPKQQCKNWGC